MRRFDDVFSDLPFVLKPPWKNVLAGSTHFAELRLAEDAKLHDCSERSEFRHAGLSNVNREAEPRLPSRVDCRDLACSVMV